MGVRVLLLVRLLIRPGLLLGVWVLLWVGLLRRLLVRLLLGVLLCLLRVLLVRRGLLRVLLVVRARLLWVGLLVRPGLLLVLSLLWVLLLVRQGLLRRLLVRLLLVGSLLVRSGLLRGLLLVRCGLGLLVGCLLVLRVLLLLGVRVLLLLLLGVLCLRVLLLVLLVLRVLLGLGLGDVGLAVGVEGEVPDVYALGVDGLVADLTGLCVDPDHLAVVVDGVEGVGRAVLPRHDDDGSGAGPGVVQVLSDAGVALSRVPGVAQGRVGPAVDVVDSAALARTAVEAAVGVGVPGARGGHLRIAEPGLQEGTAAVDAVVGAARDDEAAVVLELRPGLEGVRVTDRGAVGVAWYGVGQ